MSEGLHHDVRRPSRRWGWPARRGQASGADRHPVCRATLHLGGRRFRPRGRLDLRIQRQDPSLVFALPPGGCSATPRASGRCSPRTRCSTCCREPWCSSTPNTARSTRRGWRGVFFRRDTWHHALSFGPTSCACSSSSRPRPRRGVERLRADHFLFDPRYHDDRWTGRWPMAADERDQVTRLRVWGETLHSLEGDGTFVETFARPSTFPSRRSRSDPAVTQTRGRTLATLRCTSCTER